MKVRDLLVGFLMVSHVAFADAIVHVRSDLPANAYLDGRLVGPTPVRLSSLSHGVHEVRVENRSNHEFKIFKVYSPRAVTAEKSVNVIWDTHPASLQFHMPPRPILQTPVLPQLDLPPPSLPLGPEDFYPGYPPPGYPPPGYPPPGYPPPGYGPPGYIAQ